MGPRVPVFIPGVGAFTLGIAVSTMSSGEARCSILGTEPIEDIDAFLASCPSDEELTLIETDFPILFEPTMRFRDPVYACREPTAAMHDPPDRLATLAHASSRGGAEDAYRSDCFGLRRATLRC